MFNKRLMAYVTQAKRPIVLNVVLQWISLVANIVLMLIVGRYFQQMIEGSLSSSSTWELCISALIVLILRSLCMMGAQHMATKAATAAKTTMRSAVYNKLIELGPAYAEHISPSASIQLAVEGCEQLEIYFALYVPQLFYSLIAPFTLFVCLAPFNFVAAFIPFVCVPLIPISIVAIQRVAKKVVAQYYGSYTNLGASFLENLEGLTTLKIYQADERRHAQMDAEAESFRQATMRVLSMQLNSITVMDVIAFGGAAASISVALAQIAAGSLPLGAGFAFIVLSAEFFIPMRTLGSFFHTAMNGMAAADRMFALFDTPSDQKGVEDLASETPGISLRNLGYSYDSKRQVLHDINLDIPAGSLTALVGPSGSGKSTLAAVLSGKNRSYTGRVMFDQQDAAGLDRAARARAITTVSFESYLFKGSVRENLLLAKPDASDTELFDILDTCRLGDFIRSMGGLDFQLEEGARNISGGQKQRLALSRALLHESPIYIFDEASSNIDAQSEQAIHEVMVELARTKTVLVISHRLSAIAAADCIYVLNQGACVESGSHAELLEQDGLYARMWAEQSELEGFARSSRLNEQTSDTNLSHSSVDQSSFDTALDSPADQGKSNGAEEHQKPQHLKVMLGMIGLVGPLTPYMLTAIALGVAGFLAAIFLTVVGAQAMTGIVLQGDELLLGICALLAGLGIIRGFLRYGEQLCNHYIAFKILARIRSKVFDNLRRLAPAKLEGKDKGDLISLLTSDIELLEVFYAHTISPVAIALIVSSCMIVFIGRQFTLGAYIAAAAFICIGFVVPFCASKAQKNQGAQMRAAQGQMNAFVLDTLYGLIEALQYGAAEKRGAILASRTQDLCNQDALLKKRAGIFRALTYALVLLFDIAMVVAASQAVEAGSLSATSAIVVTVALMSSFGPVLALSELGSSLQLTLASGARVLSLLKEQPAVEERVTGEHPTFEGMQCENISFAYGSEQIISELSTQFKPGQVVGVVGKSGSGKSTLLKLCMRFWDVDQGAISIAGTDVRDIATSHLRSLQAYMTQDTYLFNASLRDNIALVRPDASDDDILRACEDAALGSVLADLPQGLDTMLGAGGVTLSGGERQRVGLARVFLYDAPCILLDEPTSNLDGLSEAAVLRALNKKRAGKTIILVSHRASTCSLADTLYHMKSGRIS